MLRPISLKLLFFQLSNVSVVVAAVFIKEFSLSPGVPSLSFTEKPKDKTFLNTQTTEIPCRASGQVRISWLDSDGEVVRNVTGVRAVRPDGSLVFFAFSASQFDRKIHTSNYRCKAENKIGVLLSAFIRINAGQ